MKMLKKAIAIVLTAAFLVTTLPTFEFNRSKGVSAATGSEIVADANSWVGITPYVWGGTDLTTGCDCSGFVCAIYKRHGLDFVATYGIRSSYDMYNNVSKYGEIVGNTMDAVQDGYIILTNMDSNGPGHATIGAVDANGNKEIIHAANTKRGCVRDSLTWYLTSTNIVAVIKPYILDGVVVNNETSAGVVVEQPVIKTAEELAAEAAAEEQAKAVNPGYPYELQTEKIAPTSGADAVKWLQTALNNVNGENLEVDGYMGPLTKKAIKRFQKACNLKKKNGKANKETVTKLTSVHLINQMVTGITMNNEELSVIDEGQQLQMQAIISPSEAGEAAVKWTSSNKSICSVTADGIIKGVKAGTAVLRASTANGIATEKLITVQKSKRKNEWYKGRYYNANGKQKKKAIGSWHKVGSYKWFGDTSGWRARNQWVKIDGKNYYFDEYGYAVKKKWKKISGKWYYFKKDCSRAENEWIKGRRLNKKGVRTSGKYAWEETDAGWTFTGPDDWFAASTTININEKAYSFDENGFCTNK